LFPAFCINCHKEGWWVCGECVKKIVPVVTQLCPDCERLSLHGKFCEKCAKKYALKGVVVACHYKEGPIREMVHNLKYNSVTGLVEVLGVYLTSAFTHNFQFSISNFQSISNDQMFKHLKIKNSIEIKNLNLIISFVPLHWLRQAKRGYNQAELLANEVSKRTGLPIVNVLTKIRKTTRQAELSGKDRRKNLQGVFKVPKSKVFKVKGKTIILVDDVLTTGSTLNECAKVLKEAGAKKVWGLVIARG